MKTILRYVGYTAGFVGYPFIYLLLQGSQRTRVVVRHGDEVLVLRGWLENGWMLPGGGMHSGERPIIAALRELTEETGIQLTAEQLVYKGKHEAREKFGLRYGYHLFVVNVTARLPLKLQLHEISDGLWLDHNDVLQNYPLNNTTRHILQTLIKAPR